MDRNYVGSLKRNEKLHNDFIDIWETIRKEILATTDIHYLKSYKVIENNDDIKVTINNCIVHVKFIQNLELGGLRYFMKKEPDQLYTCKEVFFDTLGNLQEEFNYYHSEDFGKVHMMILAEIYPDIIQQHYS